MNPLKQSAFSLPKHLADGIWKKAETGSTIAVLSGAEPMLFGQTQVMKFTQRPKAQFVGESENKSAADTNFGTVTIEPHKVQVTVRHSKEVQWADEDYQLGVLAELSSAMGVALSRALDLGVYHAINPHSGDALSGSPGKVYDTGNSVSVTDDADSDVEQAVGLVISDGFTPNAIALDPSYAWILATARYEDGRKIYPDLGFGTDITSFQGLRAAVSTTVSAPEGAVSGGVYETENPNIRAFVGDFEQIRWGVQRQIGVEKLTAGDPDGTGDLNRRNEIALRGEVVFGWAVMDTDAFAVIEGESGS